MKLITEAGNVRGKRVLVRIDWSVPTKDGKVTDDYQIKQSLPTLEYLEKQGAEVTLATHMEGDDASTEVLRRYVPRGFKLLDNLRKDPGEKTNSESFAKKLAKGQDIFVNEAFPESHREYASIVSVPKCLPSYAGFRFAQEVNELSKVFYPKRPFLFILGGAKFDTKLPLLKKFSSIADNIFVGGALAHNFFRESGVEIGQSLVSPGDFSLGGLLAGGKIDLPTDCLVRRDGKVRIGIPGEIETNDIIVDAGPNTMLALKDLIRRSSVILWNGPLGNYEQGFKEYTLELARTLAESRKEVILGGGDTLAAIHELNLIDKFSFVSTGGGAMLDFLATGTLPGIEALEGK